MAEPSRGLFYLPIIYLWTGGVEGDVLASLAPPVHQSGERLGWTLLICMVSDLRRGHLEVSWRSSSEDHTSIMPYSFVVGKQGSRRSAIAIITVATSDWPSFSCSVSRRRHPRIKSRHHSTSSDDNSEICYDDEKAKDAGRWTNEVSLLAMRLLFLKTLVFNTLMTTYTVIKW
ncbi:hypothetical protein LDENG_00286800 [Lucifuga dentata]|nr:hypothetical protein LDENG_00286800 [Lucifuga dentata]